MFCTDKTNSIIYQKVKHMILSQSIKHLPSEEELLSEIKRECNVETRRRIRER